MSQVPTVGRIVHITQKESPEHLPAVIVYVHPPGAHRSNLALDGTLLNVGCWDPRGEPTPGIQGLPEDQTGKRPQSWHWPELIVTKSPDSNDDEVELSLEERIRVLENIVIHDQSHNDDPEIEDDDDDEEFDDEDTVDAEATQEA